MVSAKLVGSIAMSGRDVTFLRTPCLVWEKSTGVRGGSVSARVKYPRYHCLMMFSLAAEGHVNITEVFSLAANASAIMRHIMV